jgi:hypothetical protein
MIRKKITISVYFLILGILLLPELKAQSDKLPQFSLTERNGMVFISWNNPFEDVSQLIIQRSTDSVKFFRSIMSMPDPSASSNGYVDKMEDAVSMYYRIFYVLPGGRYSFTSAKKPVHIEERALQILPKSKPVNPGPEIPPSPWDSIKKKTAVQIVGKRIDDRETNPDLKHVGVENKLYFDASAFIFSNEDGNLILLLPEAEKKQYDLHVFKEDGTLLFRMRSIKERYLLVDRSNFYQSGWYKFELFEGNRLKEKNRFFIPPDGQ